MARKLVYKPVVVIECDNCNAEVEKASVCSYCGAEICTSCEAFFDGDHTICNDPGCTHAVEVLQEWRDCKEESGIHCGDCQKANFCNYSYVLHPDYLMYQQYA